MLVPQQTLAGWPAAPDPSPLQTLGLLVGFPLLFVLIVFAIARIGTAAQAARGSPAVSDPLWVGGRDSSAQVGGTSTAAIEAGDAPATGDDVGGASARW
jgi:hypothetical protein